MSSVTCGDQYFTHRQNVTGAQKYHAELTSYGTYAVLRRKKSDFTDVPRNTCACATCLLPLRRRRRRHPTFDGPSSSSERRPRPFVPPRPNEQATAHLHLLLWIIENENSCNMAQKQDTVYYHVLHMYSMSD